MTTSERELKKIIAKKENLFAILQKLYDLSKDLSTESVKRKFQTLMITYEETKSNIYSVLDEINDVQFEINEDYTPDYKAIQTINELCSYIQMAAESIKLPTNIPLSSAGSGASGGSGAPSLRSSLKIPHPSLPEFHGEIRQWETFHAVYKSMVHLNPNLTNLDRVHLLVGCLKGPAQNMYAGIAIVPDNYDIIYKTLCDKYENKLNGLGGNKQSVRGITTLTIASRYDSSKKYTISALLVEKITDLLPKVCVDVSVIPGLAGICLADNNFDKPGEIHGIIGVELFGMILGETSDIRNILVRLKRSSGFKESSGISIALPHPNKEVYGKVMSVKNHIYRVIGDQLLTYEEFATLLTEIEALLNSRPLCQLSADPTAPEALTPAHFLTLAPLRGFPSEKVDNIPVNRLDRFQLVDRMVQDFWNRWRLEYLSSLQIRKKWNNQHPNIAVGTVVILKTDNAPPLHWPLAVVTAVHPGSDGVVRNVTLKTSKGIFTRPVVKLCPLPSQ
ncbi:hypothetical protein JTB14_012055 [Gonioctena quinquepunctata]|nr:hypothetical protein JTB14_012055 [Gonioctena quinquepunctata]